MQITVSIGEEETKILKKRAKKNLLNIREQVEDIVRRSCVSYKQSGSKEDKCDDKLVEIFSREKRGKRR